MNRIFEQIAAERNRQDEKWGEQNWPMIRTSSDFKLSRSIANKYKIDNHKDYLSNDLSWRSILLEEVYGAFAETDPVKQREKMIAVCAVGVAIVESLDRQIEGGKDEDKI